MMTRLAVAAASSDGDVERRRSGGSPIRVLVTASADLEIDRKL